MRSNGKYLKWIKMNMLISLSKMKGPLLGKKLGGTQFLIKILKVIPLRCFKSKWVKLRKIKCFHQDP